MLFGRIFIAAGLVVALAGCDTTGSIGRVSTSIATVARVQPNHMPYGQQVAAPGGYVDFCMRNPNECMGGTDKVQEISLTPERWSEINQINDYVNKSVTQVEDRDLYQQIEYWAYPTARGGDCEDIVLQKRKLLMEKGWPASSLMIAVVREWSGDGHAVLIVSADKGEYVLDNKNWAVLRWQDSPYTWVKRQSRERPYIWVSLDRTNFVADAHDILPPLGSPPPFLRYAQATPSQATSGQTTPTVVSARSAEATPDLNASSYRTAAATGSTSLAFR